MVRFRGGSGGGAQGEESAGVEGLQGRSGWLQNGGAGAPQPVVRGYVTLVIRGLCGASPRRGQADQRPTHGPARLVHIRDRQRLCQHGGAIGSSALACILLHALTGENGALGVFSSFAFGAGGLAYSIYWMLAGIHTADIGDATLAKHHMRFVAIPGAGLAMLGLFGTLFLFAF